MTPYSNITNQVKILITAVFWLASVIVSAQDYEVKCPSFNSPEADFSGVFHGNDLIFCSNRAKMNLSFDDDSLTLYYTDLYVAKAKYDGTFADPEPIKGVNTLFNEGHATISSDGTRMYYTANLKRSVSNKMEKTTDYKLGIFEAVYENGQWMSKGEFPYNASNAKYSVAHPSLSENDSVLYFSSNMPGGEGKSDVYKCIWENGKWSPPINLGDKINSKGNEFFPFVNEFDVLYFSTDSRQDSEGMDIYYSMKNEEGEYEKPARLNSTINSPYDDFAYQEKPGVNMGTFSSNRNGEQDDIFIFNKYFNSFQDCHENYSANFCYHFLDETLADVDSLPLRYEWNMGDGTIIYGDSIDYCFKEYGKFPVTLSAIDTMTKMVFRKISETEITISRQDKPFILSHDTVYSTIPFETKVEFFAFDEFVVNEVNWELSDGTKYTGETFMHTFAESGYHQIKCGISGKRKKNGVIPMVCVYKNVEVVAPEAITEPEPLMCCDKREYEKITLRPAVLASNIESKQLKKIFKLIIAESKLPLAPDDALLTKIDAEIIEIKTDSSYQYAIEEAGSWQELLPAYQQLRDEGYTAMFTEEFTRAELSSSITKIIPRNPNNAIKLKSKNQHALANATHIKTTPKAVLVKDKEFMTESEFLAKSEDEPINEYTLPVNPIETGEMGGSSEEFKTKVVADQQVDKTVTTTEKPQPELPLKEYVSKGGSEAISAATVPGNPLANKQNEELALTNYANPGDLSVKENTPIAKNAELKKAENEIANAQNNKEHSQREVLSTSAQPRAIGVQNNVDVVQAQVNHLALPEKLLYRIALFQSAERVPFNDPRFSQIKNPITESRIGNEYRYSIMAVPAATDLSQLLDEVRKAGFISASIEQFDADKVNSQIVRTGKYIEPGNAKRLNIEFSKLSDIKFEYNSAEISRESYKNLNYIASMLKLEEDFTLKVGAHTCAIGGQEFNQKLSEQRAKSVVEYFESKGISKDRLIATGYGQNNPMQSNESEMGRAANRRVEFIVVFKTTTR
jgi:outer membrane protein OmpA-like peptidoglycan-associated protein